MRDRTEIAKDRKNFPANQLMSTDIIIELLLDVRDVLLELKENDR